MKILKLELDNFRGFKHLSLDIDGKSTVIYGVNGAGKSSLLAAINYLYRPLVYRITPAQGKAYQSFVETDVRIGTSALVLTVEMQYETLLYRVTRKYSKSNALSSARGQNYGNMYANFVDQFVEEEKLKANIPIFVNYGTNRTVLDIPLRIRTTHIFDQKSAYERAIENEISFRTFFEWFRYQEDIENEQIRETGDTNYKDRLLTCVRRAVEQMMDNVTNLRVQRNPLCMKVKKGKFDLRVEQLSDGEKCTLALFGDLARRMALANKSLDNPLEGEGIVLIDEVELHMHPAWQRKVLNVLKRVFPNIQFFITTHSPQVLTEADDSYLIIKLDKSGDDDTQVDIIPRLDIYDSNTILESQMGTSHNNPKYQERLNGAYVALAEDRFEDAQETLEWLRSNDSNSEDAIRLEGALRRRKYLYEKNH